MSGKEDNAERKKRNREQQAKAGERFKRRVADPVRKAVTETSKSVGNRVLRTGAAGLSGMGAAGLGGAIGKALRDEERARNVLRSVGRSAKAVVMGGPKSKLMMGEPKSKLKNEEYEKTTKTSMKKGGKVKGGSSYRKAADGVAHKGKTRGKFV